MVQFERSTRYVENDILRSMDRIEIQNSEMSLFSPVTFSFSLPWGVMIDCLEVCQDDGIFTCSILEC